MRMRGKTETGRMETVPCKYCEGPIRMTGTKMCDNCWEVSGRVRYMPLEILELIIADVKPEFLRHAHQRGGIQVNLNGWYYFISGITAGILFSTLIVWIVGG